MKQKLEMVLLPVIILLFSSTSAQNPECPALTIPNGNMKVYDPGYSALITCDEHYTIKDSPGVSCIQNYYTKAWKWTPTPGTCVVNYCEHTENLETGMRKLTFGGDTEHPKRIKAGTSAGFKCDQGYKVNGISSTTCVHHADGKNKLTQDIPECEPICKPIQRKNGEVTYSPDGLVATITCKKNRIITGNAVSTCVLKDGKYEWNVKPGRCDKNFCTGAKKMYRGRRRIISGLHKDSPDTVMAGRSIGFACLPGYKLKGSQTITCIHQADGGNEFSDDPPKCLSCKKGVMRPPIHGWAQYSLDGSTVTFTCDAGYTLKGPSVVTCDADRQWSESAPACDTAD